MAIAKDPDFEYNLDDLTRLMEEHALSPPAAKGARPKKKSKQPAATKTSEVIPPVTVSSELELERTRQENLKLTLEITKTQLELAKLTATNVAQQQVQPDPASPELPLTNYFAASTPVNSTHASFPTLETLRTRQKASSTLPHQYVFSSKGTLEYDQLSLSEFVSGYLEYLKTQPELSSSSLLSHLQLLMDKASTYTWASVRNFHLFIHNAVQSKRMSWSDLDKIRERAQTFFTHLDLRAPTTTSPTSPFNRQPKVRQSKSCETWNYTGECSCDATQAVYKEHHRCRVCDSVEHPMLHCKKRKYPIPAISTGGKTTKQSSE